MPKVTTLKGVKQLLMPGVFVAALVALAGFQGTAVAAQGQRLFSIMIHFEYEDGFEFDYVLDRGVSPEELGSALAACGASHSTGSVVRYYCYSVPE